MKALSMKPATRVKRDWIHAKHPIDQRRYHFFKNLQRRGFTVEEFAWILHRQSFRCANRGCGRVLDLESRTGYHIDHDHSCCPSKSDWCGNCVRGILCSGCNVALGGLGENKQRIWGLIEYLSASAPTEQRMSRLASNSTVENSPDIRHQALLFN